MSFVILFGKFCTSIPCTSLLSSRTIVFVIAIVAVVIGVIVTFLPAFSSSSFPKFPIGSKYLKLFWESTQTCLQVRNSCFSKTISIFSIQFKVTISDTLFFLVKRAIQRVEKSKMIHKKILTYLAALSAFSAMVFK